MSGHVGKSTRIKQEPSARLDELCDIIETCSVAHRGTAFRMTEDDVSITKSTVSCGPIETLAASCEGIGRNGIEGRQTLFRRPTVHGGACFRYAPRTRARKTLTLLAWRVGLP